MIPNELRKLTAISIAIAVLVFVWVLTAGSFNIFTWQFRAGDFYEAQAHSWLRGTWAIEPGVLGIEAFEVNGSEYTYFGIFPTLLRLPVVLFTKNLDGRLTQLSMTVAYTVILISVAKINWLIRCTVTSKPSNAIDGESNKIGAGLASITQRDRILAVVVPLAAGLGTTLFYLSSRAWVYHEAILWGVAMALVSLVALYRYLVTGQTKQLVIASISAVAALQSRPSVGIGPLVALAVLGLLALLAHFVRKQPRGWLIAQIPKPLTTIWITASSGLVAVMSYAWINYARFGELFRLPLELQTYALQSVDRQAVLAANNGTFFGLQFLPTTVFAYVRPDGMSISRVYPFIGFGPNTHVFGDVSFDTLDPVASLTTAMPLFLVGAMLGSYYVLVALRRRETLGVMWVPLFGAAAGAGTTLVFGYIAARYQGDTLPFLLLGTLIAVHQWPQLSPSKSKLAVVLVAVLALWGVAANAALAITYQRQVAPDVPTALRSKLLASQLTAARWVPGAQKPHTLWGDSLPPIPPDSPTLFVLGQCEGLYFGPDANDRWAGVERTRASGAWLLKVAWTAPHVGVIQPILANDNTGPGLNALVSKDEPNGQARIGYLWSDGNGEHFSDWGQPFPLNRDKASMMKIVFDPYDVEIKVEVAGRMVFEGFRFYPTPGEQVGSSAAGGEIAPEFLGVITPQPQEAPSLCPQL